MSHTKEDIEQIIHHIIQLCQIPSPSGFTQKAEQYIFREFQKMGYSPQLTQKHSLVIDIGGEGNPLALAAHVDTLGAMVRSIKPNGTLRITKIGGYPETYIEAENCRIHTREGKEYSGTFHLVNPAVHVNKELTNTKVDETTLEIVIDEKVHSKEDVQKLGISPGDFVSFDPRTVYTASGFLKSRHLDDKASAGIFMGLAAYIKREQISLSRKTYLVYTTYEEVGHGGAAGVPPDITEMIAVDMGAVGDDLETDEYKVSICAKDSHGPYDYAVTTQLIQLAKQLQLNFAVDIYPYYGSDVDVTLRAGYDIKHGLIGPGVSASHGYERTHREGIENTFRLLLEYITQ